MRDRYRSPPLFALVIEAGGCYDRRMPRPRRQAVRKKRRGSVPDTVVLPPGKFMVDSYLDWAAAEGVPIYESFAFDLLTVETKPWKRFGVDGAIIHVAGRGDFMTSFLLEIPPGGSTRPIKHLFEASFYVLAGNGAATVEGPDGARHQFEWKAHSVFAPPLNAPYQLFNTSGNEPARLAISCNLPAVINLFHSDSFVFDNPCPFPDRMGDPSHFNGEGHFIAVRPGKDMWETNFVPDASRFELRDWTDRGNGSTHIKFILADSVMHAHVSEMPVGSYKKAHRHGPDAHIYIISGEGYSLLFGQGDKDFTRVDWKPGWIFAPPDMMFHQHFNACDRPVRYLAFAHGSVRYPFTQNIWDVFRGVDMDVKKGGKQIEYQDQDPRIQQIYEQELRKKGLVPNMDAFLKPAL
jgi:mannose-6-phosphate isomerase-like protein (cupin superfamily)